MNDTRTRPHIGLAVRDLDASTDFYRALLGVEPAFTRDDYVRFEPAAPAVNLTLNLAAQVTVEAAPTHLGVELTDPAAFEARIAAIRAAGLEGRPETEAECCYARQDKVWFADPDGRAWEVFVVHERGIDVSSAEASRDCCPDTCCA